jgi:hypothetical protein
LVIDSFALMAFVEILEASYLGSLRVGANLLMVGNLVVAFEGEKLNLVVENLLTCKFVL